MTRLAALALIAIALAGAGRPGRVVRVEKPLRRTVDVPAGTFTMGIDEETAKQVTVECEEAYPTTGQGIGIQSFCQEFYQAEMSHMQPRDVYLTAFWIDRDEVSVADYNACIAAGECDVDATVAGDERYVHDDWPMVNVTWDEAQHFCHWRGGRLPTEAEWERAARGDGNGPWPWGTASRPDDYNHGKAASELTFELARATTVGAAINAIVTHIGVSDASDGFELLAPPGSYAWGEGPYGTRDQAGNVAEWTADAYMTQTSGQIIERSGYDDLDTTNPVRLGHTGDPRVVRGGSWAQPAFLGRVNVRDPMQMFTNLFGTNMYLPNRRLPFVGFRCAGNR